MQKPLIHLAMVGCLLAGCQKLPPRQEAINQYAHGNYTLAYSTLNNLAKKGDPQSLYAVGYMLYYGIGTAEDPDLARYYIRQAASKGYAPAHRALVVLYEDHPHRRVGEHGLTKPQVIKHLAIDRGQDLQHVAWLRQRQPEHYTVAFPHGWAWRNARNLKRATQLATAKNLPLASYKELKAKKPHEVYALGDYPLEDNAKMILRELEKSGVKDAKIVTFAAIHSHMLPD